MNGIILPKKEKYALSETAFITCNAGFVVNPNIHLDTEVEDGVPEIKSVIRCVKRDMWSDAEWFGLSTTTLCAVPPGKSEYNLRSYK